MNNKTKLNYVVDVLMFLTFIANLYFTVNFDRKMHSATGYIFIFLVIIHILLHWRWMVNMTKNMFKSDK